MKKNKLPYNQKQNFKVPEGYFETLEARVMETVHSSQKKELKHKKQEYGFKIPENYFENFESQLAKKLEKEQKTSKIISLLNKESFYYVAGIAAVFVAIVTTTFFQPTQTGVTSFKTLESFALENYIDESLKYSTFDVLEMFEEEEFSKTSPPEPNFDQEAILEYLNENIEETAIIFNGN